MDSLVIIGNSVVNKDYSDFVNHSAYVVRFNWLNNYKDNTGSKIDALCLASAKQHIADYLQPTSLIHKQKYNEFCKVLNEVTDLFFPIPDANRECHKRLQRIDDFLQEYSLQNKNITKYFCEDSYLEELKEYGWHENFIAPSSGYTVIRNILDDDTFSEYKIYLLGFSWEGWEGHPWHNEAQLVKQLCLKDKLQILS